MARLKECFCHKCRIGFSPNGDVIGTFIDVRTHKEHNRNIHRRSQSPSETVGSKRSPLDLEKEDPKKRRFEELPVPTPEEVTGVGILAEFRLSLALAVKGYRNPTTLIFENIDEMQSTVPNVVADSNHLDTNAFLAHTIFLEELKIRVLEVESGSELQRGDRDELLQLIEGELARLRDLKLQVWGLFQSQNGADTLMRKQDPTRISVYDTSRFFRRPRPGHDLTTACLISVLLLNLIGGLSRDQCGFLLEAFHVILSLAFSIVGVASELKGQLGEPTCLEAQQILGELPKSLAGAFAKFNIDPELQKLACCPTCCATYEPEIDKDGRALYPEFCTHKRTSSCEPCGARLVVTTGFKEATCQACKAKLLPSRNGDGIFGYPPRCTNVIAGRQCNGNLTAPRDQDWNTPIRLFVLQRCLAHIGRWFSLPGVEDAIARYTSLCHAQEEGSWSNPLQATYIRNFCGPDGHRFLEPNGNDINLIFALNVDWFNPYQNKAAGKKSSVGGLYMVCLNLPPHLRYKDEHMYLVGLIPGPNEPHVDEINHFLRHIVDDLTALWHGVYLTRTFLFPHGRIVRAALLPLVSDIPAVRKTAGFVSHSARLFCSFCQLTKKNINNLDRASWPRRTAEEHRYIAECWRIAASDDDRKAITETYGVRWSELLRLPYWDPMKFQVVDSMHNLFLGLIKHHCIVIWKMNIKSGDKVKKLQPHSRDIQYGQLNKAKKLIDAGSPGLATGLGRIRKGYIVGLCTRNGIRPEEGKDTKAAFIDAILKWREENATIAIILPTVPEEGDPELDGTASAKPDSILGSAVLRELHSDMAKTILPHWLESPPRDLGEKSHGKLKADCWRTVCSVTLVITLVRLWGKKPGYYEILENFLDLSRAIRFATYRSTSPERIESYEHYIMNYLEGLVRLYGEEYLRSNHHLALHFIEGLTGFGPAPSWWCFPFERLNGRLQRVRTNKMTRTIPLTYMMNFCRGVNLVSYISNTTRPLIRHFKDLTLRWLRRTTDSDEEWNIRQVLRAFGEQDEILAGMDFGSDILLFDNSSVENLSEEDYTKLVLAIRTVQGPNCNFVHQETPDPLGDPVLNLVNRRKELRMRQVSFRVASFSRRQKQKNCRVEFSRGSGAIAVGQIEDIFVHQRAGVTEAFFKIRRNKELDERDANMDPYRKFKDIGAKLYYEEFEAHEIVPARHVIAHIAICPYTATQASLAISRPAFVAISLARE